MNQTRILRKRRVTIRIKRRAVKSSAINLATVRVVPFKSNSFQFNIRCKSQFSDTFYTGRNIDGSKFKTTIDGGLSNAAYPFLHSHGQEGHTSLNNT
ncbi:hypothetical protein Barb4_04018 [Bacteroidales bacterium Barb4]|nr:hypothetical protein Barb4_04018 [Bacteroidales bacterium Barb4]